MIISSIARSHSLRSSISDSQSNHPSLFLTLSVPPFNFSIRITPPFEAFNLILRICQKKLSKEIVPNKWKEGASNTIEGGGRKINENKLLSKNSLMQ
ncbi:hypothetical protein P8452_61185 [Trifolium repens]|nr:hypothetical protein P8452_61185 [Trifolium repens]